MIVGIGFDLVDVDEFVHQIELPGTRFLENFTGYERRVCEERAAVSGESGAHLAARWAAKEAAVKAWSGALTGQAPPLPDLKLSEIEVRHDAWNRPYLEMPGIEDAVEASLRERYGDGSAVWHVSLSHDGSVAGAQVLLEWRN